MIGERSGRQSPASSWPSAWVWRMVVAIMAIVSNLLIGDFWRPGGEQSGEGERLSQIMRRHDAAMRCELRTLADSLSLAPGRDTLQTMESVAKEAGGDEDYTLYIFRGGELRYWHNALLPQAGLRLAQISEPVMRTANGTYYVRSEKAGDATLLALLRVYATFPYDNDYLKNKFAPSFSLPSASGISTGPTKNGVDVNGPEGEYLFTVTKVWVQTPPAWLSAVSCALLLLAFVSLLCTVGGMAEAVARRGHTALALALAAVLLACVHALMVKMTPPIGMDDTSLFSLLVFSYDWWVPSLWGLLQLSLCLLHWSYLFFSLSAKACTESRIASAGNGRARALCTGLTALCLVSFFAANGFIDLIVKHSQGLSFYAGEVDFSFTSLVKIGVMGLAFMSFVLIAERTSAIVSRTCNARALGVMLASATACGVGAGVVTFGPAGYMVGLGFALFCLIFYVMKRIDIEAMRFSHFVWIILLTSGFCLLRMTALNEVKERVERQLLADNLLFQMTREDDPTAEQLLPQIDAALTQDTLLPILMGAEVISHDDIYTHIRNHYFNGYFSRYDLQVIPCRGAGSTIQMTNNGDIAECVPYFSQLTYSHGRRLAKARDFYCIDDGDGRPCYICALAYDGSQPGAAFVPNRLYIQIVLKNTPQTAGYPDLLTNKRDRLGESKLKGYSCAKYDKSQLVFHYGTFDYPTNASLSATGQPVMPNRDSYSHLIKNSAKAKEQTIVVTYPMLGLSNVLTCFSYLFLGLLIISAIAVWAASGTHLTFIGRMSISERIQAGLVFFITALFIVVCVISGYQSVNDYEAESKRHLSAAMATYAQTITDELLDIYRSEPDVSVPTSADADYILKRISNTTGVDAHLFDKDGRLLGSSRRELFISGIAAPLMNSEAMNAMSSGDANEVFVQEHIGSMVHFAAYMPISVDNGELLGYINVPFFNDVRAMRAQVLTSIRPITNSLVFIVIMSIIASSVIARGITRPLVELRDALKRADLNSGEEKLEYPYDDEVGQVVSAYNKMTDKLHAQADQLAATERESTWREMARQIAHEIKNPLTPMKLSVQYLLKVWDERRDIFEPMLRKTAATLVEQMDQLAAVASQFSGIAKMKRATPVEMDLAAKLSATAELFGRTEEADIHYEGPQNGVSIKADPDQITSVFNNLIKNAQQSAKDGRKIMIDITLTTDGTNATATVADNGDGIDDEIRGKIFRPNFTTKSTGMGLGLAITKTIIDNAGGAISFETEVGRGTSFSVTLPLVGGKTI